MYIFVLANPLNQSLVPNGFATPVPILCSGLNRLIRGNGKSRLHYGAIISEAGIFQQLFRRVKRNRLFHLPPATGHPPDCRNDLKLIAIAGERN
jgi:hypothetical protein